MRFRLGFAGAILAIACSGGGTENNDGNNNGGNNNGGNPPGQPGGTPVANATVQVRDDEYSPASVLLAAGGKVTWNWVGSNGHSVTPSDPGSFSPTSAIAYPPASLAVTFQTEGTYNYFCTQHGVPGGSYGSGGMIGAIFVR
jgi:plastocyanin